ncbi:MAG: hypothetical protein JO316_08265 [Abitibacteriaceae bacterium]|nr:hypothetical protein [Abditibacteriaceae bacterium]
MKNTKHFVANFIRVTLAGLLLTCPVMPHAHAAGPKAVTPVLPKGDAPQNPLPSVAVLDPTEKVWSLQVTEGSRLLVRNGDVVVNSTHNNAIWNAKSSIQVQNGKLLEIGGYYRQGNAVANPAPQPLDQPATDPIPAFQLPRLPVVSNKKLFIQDNQEITLQPGVYNEGIFATGKNLHIILAPGVYEMNNGDFFMSGCRVDGQGVTIALVGNTPGAFWGAMEAQVNLSAPTEGDLKGLVIVSAAKGWNKVQLGTTRAKLVGTIYVPAGGVDVLQNSLVSATRIICLNLGVNISSFLEVTGDVKADTAADQTPADQASATPDPNAPADK